MKRLAVVALALVAAGCSSTQTIQRAKDLSASGVAYADAVDKLLDVTADRVIDFDNAEMMGRTRKFNPPAALEQLITKRNATLAAELVEINRFRDQTALLKAYFTDLQALADSTVKDDAGTAVQSLSHSISDANTTLGADSKLQLSASEEAEIGKLGGLVADAVHAATIKAALTRDAEVIGRCLALQEHQMKNVADMLKDRLIVDNDKFLRDNVVGPYGAVDEEGKLKDLPSGWADDRKAWLKSSFVIAELDAARSASKHLSGVWADILQGKSDVNSMSGLISDVNRFVTSAQALKDARKAK